ncbi:MAG TPA: hypothetical protein VK698_39290 [Kofleriaceae bacterium]|nr:hypothetical protein [Kofleriaceae bacterium]
MTATPSDVTVGDEPPPAPRPFEESLREVIRADRAHFDRDDDDDDRDED